MPVPTSIDELSTTPADNSPLGTEQVFPNLDNYLRFQAACIAQLRDRMNAEGLPLAAVMWHGGNRGSIQTARFAPIDGQLLERADYPALWAFVSSGGYPIESDATWNASPTRRASFSTGNGSTTFRMPDLNGRVVSGSIGSVTLRGDGHYTDWVSGRIQDGQNLSHGHSAGVNPAGAHTHQVTGGTSVGGGHSHGVRRGDAGAYGAYALRQAENHSAGMEQTGIEGNHGHSVEATAWAAGGHAHDIWLQASGGEEARGKVATGVWVMRVK